MDGSLINNGAQQPVLKVSISARLVPALVFIIPAIGAALSSFLYMNLMRVLGETESVGVSGVCRGLAESIYPVLGSLYLRIIFGIAIIAVLVIRMLMQTKTASPPSWFFILTGILSLVPVVLIAEAQSLIINVLVNPRNSPGLAGVSSTISLLSVLTIAAGPIISVVLIALSLISFSTSKRPKWSPLISAIIVEVLFIAAAVAFTMRYLWLNQT